MLKRLSTVFVFSIAFTAVSISSAHQDENAGVYFRDLHKGGVEKIIGHFGLPIGQALILEGVRARPSKITNGSTLFVRSINGSPFPEQGLENWPAHIQISNIHELPMSSTIILQGYEFAVWRGTAEKNWHIDVEFMVTKVVEPGNLELDIRPP